MNTTHLPVLVILVLLIGAYATPILWKARSSWALAFVFLAVGMAFLGAVSLALMVTQNGPITYHLGSWESPWGIELVVDTLGAYMAVLITSLGGLILVFSLGNIPREIGINVRSWYYTLFLLIMASMLGMILTNDLFNLFVFLEITALSACALISILDRRDAIEATLKYLLLGALGSGAILMGLGLLYMITGHLNMDFLGRELALVSGVYPRNVIMALAFFTVGFGVKTALFPLHVWLPDAYSSACSTTSALLAGLVGKAYIVAYIRVLFRIFGLEILSGSPLFLMVQVMAVAAILGGSIFALAQEDLKRMIAYSSVSQIGYIMLGLTLVNEIGLTGAILHILNHAIIKAMLFLCMGVIICYTGRQKINELEGVGRVFPLTMAAFTVGGLSMIGIPFFNGFISKWYLSLGSLEAGRPGLVLVILVSSLLNAAYYLPMVWRAFFSGPRLPSVGLDPAPKTMLVPILILAVAIIILGVYPMAPLRAAATAAQLLLTN